MVKVKTISVENSLKIEELQVWKRMEDCNAQVVFQILRHVIFKASSSDKEEELISASASDSQIAKLFFFLMEENSHRQNSFVKKYCSPAVDTLFLFDCNHYFHSDYDGQDQPCDWDTSRLIHRRPKCTSRLMGRHARPTREGKLLSMRSRQQTEWLQLLMESSLAYPRGKEEKSRNSKGRQKIERRSDTRVPRDRESRHI
ncbi:hypothetical protein AVEN_71384-1 [Araneus ventricosus]|uniref:Uncharacterized protein n=1 Tax=Araneus ventricosus TaxID=182803 RepID=A0A4Y2BK55_ARAVE|nr:hypothetical protein AVEN_71384-1 [Araneus ventricosus]